MHFVGEVDVFAALFVETLIGQDAAGDGRTFRVVLSPMIRVKIRGINVAAKGGVVCRTAFCVIKMFCHSCLFLLFFIGIGGINRSVPPDMRVLVSTCYFYILMLVVVLFWIKSRIKKLGLRK